MPRLRLAGFVLLVWSIAARAGAQTTGRVAVGAQVTSRVGEGEGTHGATSLALLWRLGHSRQGFGWDWGLNWYSAHLDHSEGDSSPFELGELHVRPLMVGYGYTRLFGATAVKASALGGYAFTTFDTFPTAEATMRRDMGVTSLSADTSNTFAIKPQVIVWHDLGKKVGLNASVGYMVARPRLTVSTPLGDQSRRIRADVLMIRVGFVYSVY